CIKLQDVLADSSVGRVNNHRPAIQQPRLSLTSPPTTINRALSSNTSYRKAPFVARPSSEYSQRSPTACLDHTTRLTFLNEIQTAPLGPHGHRKQSISIRTTPASSLDSDTR